MSAPRVAYQGEPGAFSDDAASRLLPGAQTRGYDTFDLVAAALEAGDVEAAVLPVENSISGSVPRVYDLLWTYPRMAIVDELVYRVEQTLIGLSGATIAEIREVRSHPVALEQCRRFLSEHPAWRSVIVGDTAGAVRAIVELGDRRVAAIAASLAAKRYGADILHPAIQDVHDNFTRFFLIRRDGGQLAQRRRACIALSLAHRPGSLRDALAAFADANINLRSLASRPSLEEPFTYRFYCELEGVDRPALDTALARIDGTYRILGAY